MPLRIMLCLLLVACLAVISCAQPALIQLWPGQKPFQKPVAVVQAPGLPGWLFVVEQRGKIYRVNENAGSTNRFLLADVTAHVSQRGNETGLLGLAFHPDFQRNGRFFISYTQGQGKKMVSRIAELKVKNPKMPHVPNPTPKTLISVAQPFENHNGGAICFGPDGYLYFSWGDGGSGGDPLGNAQKINSLLGKIHRIDVNNFVAGKAYSIPKNNPFVAIPEARPEIFALGLRNVWQMHFDAKTGKLWAGDVGQNAYEEIDIVERGKNYGWNEKEALANYAPVKGATFEDPVWSYPQTHGDQSVTGGVVYHGPHKPWQNQYIFGDYVSGRIWRLHPGTKENKLILESGMAISAFGLTCKNEIVLCDHARGRVYMLVP